MIIEKEIGTGADCVYVYYNPNDKKLALMEGNNRWECKIGFSSTDPVKRIQSQGYQTSMAREPVIGLVIRTTNGYYTESFIHKRLYSYRVPSKVGSDEWFLTSPAEVESIFVSDILPNKDKDDYCEYEISDTSDFGSVLNSHRKKVNMTNENLCNKVKVSRDTLWRLFHGQKTVCLSTVFKVLNELDLDITLKSKLPADKIKIHTSARKAR